MHLVIYPFNNIPRLLPIRGHRSHRRRRRHEDFFFIYLYLFICHPCPPRPLPLARLSDPNPVDPWPPLRVIRVVICIHDSFEGKCSKIKLLFANLSFRARNTLLAAVSEGEEKIIHRNAARVARSIRHIEII